MTLCHAGAPPGVAASDGGAPGLDLQAAVKQKGGKRAKVRR